MKERIPGRRLPEEDEQALRRAMQDVKPLKSDSVHRPGPRRPRRRRAPEEALRTVAPLPFDKDVQPGESLHFCRGGVQEGLMRRLRRGLIVQQAGIDLHGMTIQQAWDSLDDFIAESRARGLRCVRVVHGKGYRSGARGPVLKSAVNSWLRHNHDVIAFVSARSIDGGTGAVYVLLRA
ncbi:MAG: Smr/MutS family protein [Proteobacteria bacterium]|nr:Smr/MutS family protein [Pseudomonadota bacterium]